VGRGFAVWIGVAMLGTLLFVVGMVQTGDVEGCHWDPDVQTYDQLGVPVTGACVGGSTSNDWIPWATAGGVLMVVGIAGTTWSAISFSRRVVSDAFDGIGGPGFGAAVRDLTDVMDGRASHHGGADPRGNGAAPPDGAAPPPRPWR
jgi:hypothetical protein